MRTDKEVQAAAERTADITLRLVEAQRKLERVRDFLTTAHEIEDPDVGDVMVVYADDLRKLIEEES